jgi:predicted HTH transcriptional regulator
VYLSRDRRWLDYRPIGDYRAQADFARAGVEFDFPEDPESEIQTLLSQGEGQRVEFKSQLPRDSDDSKRTVFKTVAAFANGQGGSIVFGVERDEATVCGLDDFDHLKERDRLAQLARSIVTPAPAIEVRQYDVGGKMLLVLAVEPGSNPPYGITLPGKKDKPVEFYVRRDATTFPARPEEIRNTVLATAPPSAPGLPWSYSG